MIAASWAKPRLGRHPSMLRFNSLIACRRDLCITKFVGGPGYEQGSAAIPMPYSSPTQKGCFQ